MRCNLYADGSMYSPRPEYQAPELPGGWACIITDFADNTLHEITDSAMTTNIDRMELTAVVRGLTLVHRFSPDADNTVRIYSDSRYVLGVLLNHMPPQMLKRFTEQSKYYSHLARFSSKIERERDIDIRKDLDDILASTGVAFMKVVKKEAPVQHARCDRLAAEARMDLAKRLGYPVNEYMLAVANG